MDMQLIQVILAVREASDDLSFSSRKNCEKKKEFFLSISFFGWLPIKSIKVIINKRKKTKSDLRKCG